MATDSMQLPMPLSEEEAKLLKQGDADRDSAVDKKKATKDMKQNQKKPAGSAIAPKLQLNREQIKEIFREHDIDGDGCLSVSELTRAFGFMGSILPFYKAHYGLAHADADGDGLISEDELDKLVDYVEKVNRNK